MPSSKYISSKKVQWSGSDDSEILFLGEAPGYDEEVQGIPFVGKAGDEFNRHLGIVGFDRDKVKVGNISNYRPADNNFDYLRDSPELNEGLKEINEYLSRHKDKIKLVVLQGKEPLRYLLGKTGKSGSISKWRGSFIRKNGVLFGIGHHPSFLNYNGSAYPVFASDFSRFREVFEQGYKEPCHDFIINPKGLELEEALREIENAPVKGCDIETSRKNPKKILCLGVSVSSTRAFCFWNNAPFFGGLELGFQTICERVFSSSGAFLWHNGYSFDREVYHLNGLEVPLNYDTYIASHALEPELPRTLAFLGSVYTWEPYWKGIWGEDDDAKSVNEDKTPKEILMPYCCIDTIVLPQIHDAQQTIFKSEPLCKEVSDYEHEQIVPLFTHLSRAGLPIDKERQDLLRKAVEVSLKEHQETLNAICKREVNVNGKIILPQILYAEWKLPHKKKKRKDGTSTTTTDEDAIVSLIGYAKDKVESFKTPELKFHWEKIQVGLKLILLIRGEIKLLSNYINFKMHDDGRVRSSYHIGPETGRGSSNLYVDHTGLNTQTFPREAFQV